MSSPVEDDTLPATNKGFRERVGMERRWWSGVGRGRHHRRHSDPAHGAAAARDRRGSTSSRSIGWRGTRDDACDEFADDLGLRSVALATIDDLVAHLSDGEVDGPRVLGDDDLARIDACRAEHGPGYATNESIACCAGRIAAAGDVRGARMGPEHA